MYPKTHTYTHAHTHTHTHTHTYTLVVILSDEFWTVEYIGRRPNPQK